MKEAPRYITPKLFGPYGGLTVAHSTRHGGISPPPLGMNTSFRVGDAKQNVRENRRRFLQGLGIGEEQLAIPGQVHSATVHRVETAGPVPECDGLVTGVRGVFLSVTVADCLPLLMAAPAAGVVAAVHAGWRGTVAGIATRAVALLTRDYGIRPDDLLAYLGPSARACCYEIGGDIAGLFATVALRTEGERHFLDLEVANRLQLLEAGVKAENIESSPDCTISRPDLYHSYRRDGNRSGRMMAVIGFRSPAS